MKGVIFDFNGTLFLDDDKHVKAWGEMALEIRGKAVTAEELHKHMNGKPNSQIIRYLNGGKEDPAAEEYYSNRKEEIYRRCCSEDQVHLHLIAGAEQLFDVLKERNIPFTIASASIKPNIDFFVEIFRLDHWIDPESIVYDDGTYENKIAMFKKAADVIGVPLQECTVFEDSFSGIRSAAAAGVQDIRLLDSSHIYEQVKELPQIRQVLDDMTAVTLDD